MLIGGLLSACASRPIAPLDAAGVQVQRSAVLATIQQWGFSGRIALSDGEQGGSGRLDWRQHHSGLVLNFQAALGQGSWRLTLNEESAMLESGDGAVVHADNAERLMRQQVGWDVPVDALQFWVRGLPNPNQSGVLQTSELGLPSSLKQQGWQIEYQRWDAAVQPPMPKKLIASRGDYRVKMVIRDWQFE